MPTTVTPSDEDEEIAAFEADEDEEITDVVGRPVQVGAVARGLSVVEAPRGAFSQDAVGDAFAIGWGDEVDSLDAEPYVAPQAWPAVSETDTLAPRATPRPARPRASRSSVGGWLAVMVGVVGIFVGGTLTIVAGSLILGALRAPAAPPPVVVVAPPPVAAPAPMVAASPVAPPVEEPVVEAPVEAVATAAPKPRARTTKAAPAPEPVVVAEPEVKAAPPPPAPVAAPEPEDDDKKGLFRRKKER